MALAITNKILNLPTDFISIDGSTQNQFPATGTSTSVAAAYQEFRDYTTTGSIPLASQVSAGAIGDFGVARRAYRALIYFKSFVPSTATSTGPAGVTAVGPVVALEAATSTAYSPVYVLDQRVLAGGSTAIGSTGAGGPVMFLFGMMPLLVGAQFARINFYAGGAVASQLSSSTGLDALIQGV